MRPISLLLSIPIHLYRLVLSPALHALGGGCGCGCRFHPSCSAYALEALRLHGPGRGFMLSLGRIVKCHPWNEGGLDPVPAPGVEALKKLTCQN